MMMVRTMVRMTMVGMIYLMSIMMPPMRMVLIVVIILSLAGLGRRVGDWLAVKENQSLSLECRSSGVCITIIMAILIHYNYSTNTIPCTHLDIVHSSQYV